MESVLNKKNKLFCAIFGHVIASNNSLIFIYIKNSWINFRSLLKLISMLSHTQPTFQRWINVVDQRWNNVDSTLKMKLNSTSVFQRSTTLIQCRTPTLKQHRNNVETTLRNIDTTLYQHCFKVASMLMKLYQNQSGYWIWTCKQINFYSS